jgi:hypothetical protein
MGKFDWLERNAKDGAGNGGDDTKNGKKNHLSDGFDNAGCWNTLQCCIIG